MKWQEQELFAVDTETTGIEPGKDRIVELGAYWEGDGGALLHACAHAHLTAEQALDELAKLAHRQDELLCKYREHAVKPLAAGEALRSAGLLPGEGS